MSPLLAIVFPRDGDMLTRHDGVESETSLTVPVTGAAPPGQRVLVNGVEAQRTGPEFRADVALSQRRNTIVVQAGDAREEIAVWWRQGSRKQFRFSADDNILFLQDLAADPSAFPSLFDHWYLGFWRGMHEEFGAKIHLNIYYQTDGFDLTGMPDRWKGEWRDNAHWLHLSFHALQDKPDRPYRNASYSQIAHDYDLVCGHIRRFAGNEVLGHTTTVHWAECPKAAITALRDRGIERLIGLFTVRDGVCTTGYYLGPEQCAYCDTRGTWYDRETGLTFITCSAVVNALPLDGIEPHLEWRASSPHTGEMMELLIHEQYFRKELHYYQADVRDKVRKALKWVTDRGYAPAFWDELG